MSFPVGSRVIITGTIVDVDNSSLPYQVKPDGDLGEEWWVPSEAVSALNSSDAVAATNPAPNSLSRLEKQRDVTGDITLRCVSGPSRRAHRAVLAAASPVFHAMLYGEMKEASEEDVDCSLIPDAATLDEVLANCYGCSDPVRIESFHTFEALQLPYEFPVSFVPQLTNSLYLWDMYEKKRGFTAEDLTRLIESANPRFGELISRYKLTSEQLTAVEAFLPCEVLILIYKRCAHQQGKSVRDRDNAFVVGTRVKYDGTNHGGSRPPPAGSIGVITAIYKMDHGAVVKFDEDVCSPRSYTCNLENLELV